MVRAELMQALVPEGGAAKPAFLRENALWQGKRGQLSYKGHWGKQENFPDGPNIQGLTD